MEDLELGRDFWLFRGGQLISVVGDACAAVAMAWWVLGATGSPAKMGYMAGLMMFARTVIMPLAGPLGDKFPRKALIIAGDLWRGLLYAALAAMAFSSRFHFPAVCAAYMLVGLGTALFNAGYTAIIPALVPRGKVQLAMQRSQAVSSVGMILGGAVGGLLVTALGAAGALAANAVSFFLAAAASWLIKADTRPQGVRRSPAWAAQLKSGARAMVKVPTLLWLGVFLAVFNLLFSPANIGLPVLVKDLRHMPPWFMGALQSAMSAGAIYGSFEVGRCAKLLRGDNMLVAALAALGGGLALLPLLPAMALPLAMFGLGAANSLFEIPFGARRTLATPDAFRARVGTASMFMYGAMSPVGTALSGALIARFGLPAVFGFSGLALAAGAPLLFLVPGFRELFTMDEEHTRDYFGRLHPEAFQETTATTGSALP